MAKMMMMMMIPILFVAATDLTVSVRSFGRRAIGRLTGFKIDAVFTYFRRDEMFAEAAVSWHNFVNASHRATAYNKYMSPTHVTFPLRSNMSVFQPKNLNISKTVSQTYLSGVPRGVGGAF